MKLSYVRALESDAHLLTELYNKAFYADYLRYGECPAYGRTPEQMQLSIKKFPKDIIICENVPVGVISVDKSQGGKWYVGCLCVIPEYQRRGIGTLAVRRLLSSRDWSEIELITPSDKTENLRFYKEKCGFVPVGAEMDGGVCVCRLRISRNLEKCQL